MESFLNWYYEKCKSVHVITNDQFLEIQKKYYPMKEKPKKKKNRVLTIKYCLN